MANLDFSKLIALMKGGQEEDPQTVADRTAYENIQRTNLETPVTTYQPPNLGDVYTSVSEGKGAGGKILGGLSALLNYGNTSEGKKIIAGMGSGGMAPGMLNEANLAREKEIGMTNASIGREAQRKASIAELLKDTAKNASEERKSTNPEILRLLGAQQENEFNKPFKTAEMNKNNAETAQLPSIRALEEKKAAQAAAEFNAKQEQEAEQANLKAPFLTRMNPFNKGVKPQIVSQPFATESDALKAGLPSGSVVTINGRKARIK
jgi:hypothetical protein